MSKERIPGGKSKGMSLKDIAIKHTHGDSTKFAKMHAFLKLQLSKGVKTELEHTSSKSIAREIAMDHLFEDPNYYKKLEKMEKGKKSEKIGLKELSEMIKSALNEEFVGGVNYDTDVALELKVKVGDLSKIIPYALELGNRVTSDNTGKVKVFDDDKLVKVFGNVDEYLRGIKYGALKISEDEQMGMHKDHEASMAKGELRSLVKNAKSIYEKISEGDELPGWVSSYITLASDYMNSVNQYMEQKMHGDGSLDESEGSGKKLTANELAAKYDLQKTGTSGKYKMEDFQPILDEGSEDDKYALALIFANMFLGKNFGLSWDDLPDINSLWDCVESSDTIDELITNVKESCRERISEEGGEGMLD